MSKHRDIATGFEAGSQAAARPPIVTNEHLEYLDELRESGDTNMYGARPFLMSEFPELSNREASTVLAYWMGSFGKAER